MALSPASHSSFSQSRWMSEISKLLEEEVRVDIDVPVSIFRVPTTITIYKPEAYVPRVMGLGPYHHFREELYEMERYKLAAAVRLQKQFQSIDFKELVHKLRELEYKVRACYHKYLDIDGEALTWVMAIDGLFLLDFLHFHMEKKANISSSVETAHLVDSAGRKLAHHAILGDIMLLENQIPMFFLKEILSIQCSLIKVSESLLPSMLLEFCKMVSPLELNDPDLQISEVLGHAHLLDLLYHFIKPKFEPTDELSSKCGQKGLANFDRETPRFDGSSPLHQLFDKLWNLISNTHIISKIMGPIKTIIGGPLKIVTSIPISTILPMSKKGGSVDSENNAISLEKKPPVVEEIMIPSVTHLLGAGVQFCTTSGGITSISFDEKERKFYLPVITLNTNSEVILRNLIAYEASIESESLVLARYMELMNGIIDTDKDAKILRERKIIVNSLNSDADVAQLFNGMSKCIRLTNVSYIDKAIENVNKCFNNTRKVRIYKGVKKYVYGSWKILTLLAVILLILLMVLQSFCSIYSCPRIFHTISNA